MENKLVEYVKNNNGYITYKELNNLKIHKQFLTNLVKANKLEKVGVGVYKLVEYPVDNFYILSNSSKNSCFSHATALYLHNMTDRIPLVYDITVPYNYSGNLLKNKNVSLKYVKKTLFNLGLINIKTINGLSVKCYDLERTICDIIKDKNKMDKEIYSKALKGYSKSNNKNLLNLIKYSKKLNIEKEVVELMEVLL